MENKNVKFAFSRALNWTANEVNDKFKGVLPKDFIIRNRFLQNSLRVDPSNKNKLRAQIGFLTGSKGNTDFMGLQVTGGSKRSILGHRVSVPTWNIRPKDAQILKKGKRPVALRNKKRAASNGGYFVGTVKGKLGLWQRPSNRQRRGAYKKGGNAPLKLMFRLYQTTKVKKHMDMEGIADQVVQKSFAPNFQKSFMDAISQ